MALDFSASGAAGAGNSLDDAPDPGAGAAPTTASALSNGSFASPLQMPGTLSSSASSTPTPSAPSGPKNNPSGGQDTTGVTPWGQQFLQNTGSPNTVFGGFYAEGGAIPDDDDPSQGQDNGLAAQIAKSLASVQEVLAYGRQKHGLGNSNEGAIQEASNRMPSVPGNQSNSGVKPVQPMPGPLPPTSNPFGKRADAQPQDDQDDGAGAIDDTEEEMA